MRVIVQDDEGKEMLSYGIAKSVDEPVMVLMPNEEERPTVVAALAEAISFCSPPLRPLPEFNVTFVDGRALMRKRPDLKIVE